MVIQSKKYLASSAGYKTQMTEKKGQKVEQNKSAWREGDGEMMSYRGRTLCVREHGSSQPLNQPWP